MRNVASQLTDDCMTKLSNRRRLCISSVVLSLSASCCNSYSTSSPPFLSLTKRNHRHFAFTHQHYHYHQRQSTMSLESSMSMENDSHDDLFSTTNRATTGAIPPPTTKSSLPTLTYVEFYSGVGGWTMALHEASQIFQQQKQKHSFKLERLANLDHSDLCQTVLEYNFPLHQYDNDGDDSTTAKKRKRGQTTSNANQLQKQQQKQKRKYPLSIERLTIKQMERWNANIYVMSPPCQPHTRQHSNQHEDLQDPRSKSFLHLCGLLSQMKHDALPHLILMENVIGFEKSGSCQRWREVMAQRNYHVGHFHLNPTQIGIPNDRPRYYSVAVLQKQEHVHGEKSGTTNSGDCDGSSWYTHYLSKEREPNNNNNPNKNNENETKDNISKDDDKATVLPPIHIQTSIMPLEVYPLDQVVVGVHNKDDDKKKNDGTSLKVQPISNFLDPPTPSPTAVASAATATENEQSPSSSSSSLSIPTKLLQRSAAWCFDIVTPIDCRSACFTHAYGKYIKGTGSILYTGPNTQNFQLEDPSKRQFDPNWYETKLLPNDTDDADDQQQQPQQQHLRYFSGTEIARLLGFPVRDDDDDMDTNDMEKVRPLSFSFPDTCTLKQQWKLLGNSINVRVASKIVLLGLYNLMDSAKSNDNDIDNRDGQ